MKFLAEFATDIVATILVLLLATLFLGPGGLAKELQNPNSFLSMFIND